MSIFEELKKPFPPERIRWRIGSTSGDKSRGMALAYIDARDLFDRLDEVCSPANWQSGLSVGTGDRVYAGIGLRLIGDGPEGWIWRWDGAGATGMEGDKGAISDALKRAGVQFGIGRYLYTLDSPWVPIEPAGRSYKLAPESLKWLAEYLQGLMGETPMPTMPEVPRDVPPVEVEPEAQPVRKPKSKAKTPPVPTGKASSGSGKAVKLSQVWAAGFKAAEQCEAPQFAALNYAQEKAGTDSIKKLDGNQEGMKIALDAIEEWLAINAPNTTSSELPPSTIGDDAAPF